jgi:simple sugar transport system permease protein/D-xylose transport system permease protein
MNIPATSTRVAASSSAPHRLGHLLRAFRQRLRDGDLGSTPVVIGLIIIWIAFQVLNPAFLTPANLVNLALQCAAVGTISIGVVLVLLLGQIDLSVGSISGLAAAILGVTFVGWDWPVVVSVALALAAGAVIGAFYGLLYSRFGVPSFVITLAGLLGVLGIQLWVLGDEGSINIPFNSWIVRFAQQMFLPNVVSYIAAVVAAGLYCWVTYRAQSRRAAAGLGSMHITETAVRALSLLVLLGFGSWYLNKDRGIGLMFVLFVVLVVCTNYMLTRTKWGRSVYAVGGSVEAARRAGIRVNRVYVSVFIAATTFAALGGLLAASRLAAANQSSGGGDANLTAIAAAVIGGTSLFGGRGSAWSALLGIVVIMSISSGLTLLTLDSSVRYMVTGGVLLLAVIVDAISRRSRASHGVA